MRSVLAVLLGTLLVSCGGGGGSKDDGGAGSSGRDGSAAGTGGNTDGSAGTAGADAAAAGVTGTAGTDAGAAGSVDGASGGSTDAGLDTASTDAAKDTGGMKMACDLAITDATGSNVGFSEFGVTGAQGATKAATSTKAQTQGIHAQMMMGAVAHVLDLTVAGPTPVVGASYAMGTIDATLAAGQGAIVFSTIDGLDNYSWDPVAGGTVTVSAIAPGVISSYYNATFKLDGLQFTPRTAATANKATGTFKLTGLCQGAITK